MNMSPRPHSPWLIPALLVLLALPFVTDLFLPLGYAPWIIYIVPTVLTFVSRRSQAPFAVAGAATLLLAIGYGISSPGIDPRISIFNRSTGAILVWVLAGTGYIFIRTRLRIEREEWLKQAEIGLAHAASGELSVRELGENILEFLCSYCGAQAGAIFIRNGEGLRREATYAVPSDVTIPPVVTEGDGLLGEAVRAGKNLTLRDVPDGYLYIGSALGRAKPSTLVIGLATIDGQRNAVLEMALPEALAERADELLGRVAGQMGSAIRSGKYRAELRELLEKTQAQSEELQVQSEELQASNEELEAQSRELQDAASRLESQQNELEQTNAQLEEQARELELQRDNVASARDTLKVKAEELELASRYKSEFLANMSHELRTPLNSLLIMARLLAENTPGNLTAEQVEKALTIEMAGNDLLALINDILDLSKIEAGKLELRPCAVEVGAILNKLVAVFEDAARAKGLRLSVAEPANLPELHVDAQRLEQVLNNFLSNAIKFTEQGEVGVEVSLREGERVAFSVRDTGIGILEEHQQAIFKAFRQADGTISRRFGGTGLGLSISRELAELMGGEITVESVSGEGSRFTLELPLTQGSPAAEVARHAAPPPTPAVRTSQRTRKTKNEARPAPQLRLAGAEPTGRTILVVEDDAPFAGILAEVVHEHGFDCLIAECADEGVALAKDYLPQAVILDINLPDHTGLSVLDRLKHAAETRHIPVHIVSVHEDARPGLTAGAIGHLLKPVHREQLVAMLQTVERRLTREVSRVLIVEDDVRQAQSIRDLLALREVETVQCHSLAECVERLRDETFDCVVLDFKLPDGSALDLLEAASSDDSISFPPVIIYTGRDLTTTEELRLRRHSSSIIVKGARSPERLLDEVTLFLHRVVADLPDAQQQLLARSLARDALLEGRRILVVEDDVRNIYALTSVFEPHGVEVSIARNGREAIEMLETAGADTPVDLVLMDLMMPEMDGLTATREIRARSWGKSLPIIALTAKARPTDHRECLEAGANDYLAKPLDVDKLISLVRVWLPR